MEEYYLIHWPEVQSLMDIDDFSDHSILNCEESSAYFVEKDWYDRMCNNKK